MFQISVIIPTFNRKSFLFNAIDSVLTQTYKNIELIIVDDGSSDKTIDQLKKYKSKKLDFDNPLNFSNSLIKILFV